MTDEERMGILTALCLRYGIPPGRCLCVYCHHSKLSQRFKEYLDKPTRKCWTRQDQILCLLDNQKPIVRDREFSCRDFQPKKSLGYGPRNRRRKSGT